MAAQRNRIRIIDGFVGIIDEFIRTIDLFFNSQKKSLIGQGLVRYSGVVNALGLSVGTWTIVRY